MGEDLHEVTDPGDSTDIPDSAVAKLSEIMRKGRKYVEAYAVLLDVRLFNPGISDEEVLQHTLWIKPELRKEIMEASSSILPMDSYELVDKKGE